ncbi:hypothetical protein Tco_0545772 [Tanacetum coccineum]
MLNPETTTTTPATTYVTNAQLKAMIDQGVIATLAARDAHRNTNGDDSYISGAGTEGVTGLSQWFERMESVFYISNFTVENQVKFATCTLHSVALTWWNNHVKTVNHDAAYGEGTEFAKLYPTLSGIGFVVREDVSRRIL